MFDIASSEFLLVLLLALLVIGPKDLPKVLRVVGRWVSKARTLVSQFRMHVDDMVREAEMKDIEEQWEEQNARIMREHPAPEDAGDAQNADADRPATGKEPQLPLDESSEGKPE